MEYVIIATLGPASDEPRLWRELVASGATRFRLNSSHLTPGELAGWVERVQSAFGPGEAPQITVDLQGSKWRLGEIEARVLEAGARLNLISAESAAGGESSHSGAPGGDSIVVPHEDFFSAVTSGNGVVRINDGKVELEIDRAEARRISCRVLRGGPVGPRKGISLPGSTFRREGLLERDRAMVEAVRGRPGLSFALSYVLDGREIEALKKDLEHGARVIAKLERPEALEAAGAIGSRCDELWLCRGDLGAEAGAARMAELVHGYAESLNSLRAPSILAGQVLEHMAYHPVATRSELCHLYDALRSGFSGFVLSDETAVGDYPVESCRTAATFLGAGR